MFSHKVGSNNSPVLVKDDVDLDPVHESRIILVIFQGVIS